MLAQYSGAKRFYFKYRPLMDDRLRRHRVAYCCFIMSRQVTRPLRRRLRFLMLALRNSSPAVALSYARSSVPRLVGNALTRNRE
jgi:hypothetical protein